MPTRTCLATLACCLLSAPALAQTTRDAGDPGGLAPAAAGVQLHYIRVPKTGSTSLMKHIKACVALRYHDHALGCLDENQCNSTHVHVKEPDAIVFGVVRAPCEHFDSVHRHLLRRKWKYLPYGQKTTPMQLAQWLITLRRSGCSRASPEYCAAAANGPARVQAFARRIFGEYPQRVSRFNSRVFLLPQAFYLPDAPWSRQVCYSRNSTELTRQVNRVYADAGVQCLMLPEVLESTTRNVNAFLSPRALRGRICLLIETELYPEDAALYHKHCSSKAPRPALL
ncbi:hypothetical protein T492DRAFT_993943 [Pavlovales sp. CCMP2436]|nr:hypothetical protein T492DRAFT_993943 [Pavlovales sp. CCMP2436]